MKTLQIISMAVLAVLVLAVSAGADLINVYSVDTYQDPLHVDGWVHELGDMNVFPVGQQIEVIGWWTTSQSACIEYPGDNPNAPNAVVQIKNLCSVTWFSVFYVADPWIFLSNEDGLVGNVGRDDESHAFRIDSVGYNKPLIYESMTQDNCFEPGEIWNFIIQDYVDTVQKAPPSALDSRGIAGMSLAYPPSTGSIITPEPTTIVLMVSGGLFALICRHK